MLANEKELTETNLSLSFLLRRDLLVEKLTYQDLLRRYLESNRNTKKEAKSEFEQIQNLLKTLTKLKQVFETTIIDKNAMFLSRTERIA